MRAGKIKCEFIASTSPLIWMNKATEEQFLFAYFNDWIVIE